MEADYFSAQDWTGLGDLPDGSAFRHRHPREGGDPVFQRFGWSWPTAALPARVLR